MDNEQARNGTQPEGDTSQPLSIEAAIREAAFQAWVASRDPKQDASKALFDRVYLGHYAAVAAYTEDLVDQYELDAKLDAAIAEPFRQYVDIDVEALSRALVRNGTLYSLRAAPIGVWVFNGEIE